MKTFGGNALFIRRADINTDEIIPASYLDVVTKDGLAPHLLEDLKLDSFHPESLEGIKVVITRENHGCGSSREHAPWAYEAKGINLVVAQSFARIFRQNMANCGMLAAEVSENDIENLFAYHDSLGQEDQKTIFVEVDIGSDKLTVVGPGKVQDIIYTISEFDKALIKAGGWVEYADIHY